MERYQQLIEHMRRSAPVAVAFSGGVDSALLLKAAHDALQKRALAITIDAPMQFRQELDDARTLATRLGVRQIELRLDWSALSDLHTNPEDRCYRCKRTILMHCLRQLALMSPSDQTAWTLVDGSNRDDQQVHRPGRRALAELGVRSPLAELGFTKADIRQLSRSLGLPSWDKPSQSCLLTRFPHGHLLTVGELQRVEASEARLRLLGLRIVRVRSLGSTARVELGHDELQAAHSLTIREAIIQACCTAGFAEAVIDPVGYRSGSMD